MERVLVTDTDPVLLRQLRKLGLEDANSPPDVAVWRKVLDRISDHYRHIQDDRNLIARSLEISSAEMRELHEKLQQERDRLREVVSAISDALSLFHDVTTSNSSQMRSIEDATGPLSKAKRAFSKRLGEIYGLGSGSSASQDIEAIHTNFLHLTDQLVRLLRETADRASLKKELEVARAVQKMLVPSDELIERSSIHIAGYFHPAADCGGDWWTVHDLPENRVLTIIGDVTGHGVSAAIITGAAKAACDLARTMTEGRITPEGLLQMMNCAIYEAAKQQMLMTCTASIYDSRTQTLTIANAGHTFPYLIRQNQVRPIMARGSPLGAASIQTYAPTSVRLEKGDRLLWFTDGVVECENGEGAQFSEKRLRAICERAAASNPKELRDAILNELFVFCGDRMPTDDVTFVVGFVQ